MGTKPLFEAIELGISSECEKCKAFSKCKNPFMKTHGDGDQNILILSDFPTRTDDEKNYPFSGEIGEYFEKLLNKMGFDLRSDFFIEHSIGCAVSKEPSITQINNCRKALFERIKKIKPKAIIALGSHATRSLFGTFLKNNSILSLDGTEIPYKDLDCWVYPIQHPRFAIRNKWDECISSSYNRSLKEALKKSQKNKKFPKFNPEKKIKSLIDYDEIMDFLEKLSKYRKATAFDYECSGLNPYKPNHVITSISITKYNMDTVSFPIEHSETGFSEREIKKIKKQLKVKYLKNNKIYKIAHHSQFESKWSRQIIGCKPKISWCTMTTQHVINTNPKSTGLKHQAFTRWGIHSYEKETGNWIDSSEGDYNRMYYQPIYEQLLYVGYDSYLTMKLYKEQKKEIPEWNQKFYNKGLGSFEEMGHNGMKVSIQKLQETERALTKKVKKIERKILRSKEVKKHEKKTKEDFNIDSSSQLSDLLYKTMNIEVKNKTVCGNPSVDETALLDINHWIVKSILERRKIQKITGTYLSQFFRYNCNGYIHPTFALHIPRSLRSSSFEPNFQNLPKRNMIAKEAIRTGIIAEKDCYICELDFSGIEVCTSAIYHQDPNFINYLQDPHSDMHRDCYSSDTKFLTKNGFKYYFEIKEKEKIGQYNKQTKKIEFVLPTNRICKKYNGDMYFIKNRYINLLITPNHRLYLKHIHKEYEIIKAKNVVKSSYYAKTCADITNKTKLQNFHFEAVYGIRTNKTKKYHEKFTIKPNDMFELLGYLITDGHFKYHKQGAYRISLSQHKQPHRKKIKACIDRIKSYTNFNFHEEKTKWSMSNKSFCSWLCENFGVNKINRKLPDFIKFAPTKQLRIFFDACILGDGSYDKNNIPRCIYTISTKFIEDFQFICMRLGYSSRFSKLKLKGNRKTQVYIIYLQKKSEQHIKTQDKNCFNTVKYQGKVCCFTVPTGILVVQRDNKITIQGNCGMDIFMLDEGEITKQIRFYSKNCWTFPQFYGDYYGSCAPSLVKNVFDLKLNNSDISVREHLKQKGISSYSDFENHCKKCEDILWNERFPIYTKWKNDIRKEFCETGKITTKFGFVFSGILDKKQVTNYPVQSTAGHILLWCLNRAVRIGKKEKWRSKFIGQVHDSIVMYVHKDELEYVLGVMKRICEVDVIKRFKWINVPYGIDIEISKLNGNFAEMTDYKI